MVRGNPGEKIPTGTRSRLWNAQRVLDSKIPHQAPADSNVPFGKFSPSFPGQVVDGTEDAKVFAIPNPGRWPLSCSIPSRGWGRGRYGYCSRAVFREVFFVSGAKRKSQKTRGLRRDATKSARCGLFITINGVFCRFCASRSVLLFAAQLLLAGV